MPTKHKYVNKNCFVCFFVSFFLNKQFAYSLFYKERCEQITHFTHKKWATVSDLLRSITKNEIPWANHSGLSPKMSKWANGSFILSKLLIHAFFCKKKWFAQKINEQIPNPAKRKSKFPTLQKMFKINIFGSMLELQSVFSEPMAQVIKQPLKVKFLN